MRTPLILAATSLLAITGAGAATVIGATKIVITSTANDYLQVAEVVATEFGSGTDVALASLGATAAAPDQWNDTTNPINAIDGNFAGDFNNGEIFHSAGSNGLLTINLAYAATLSSLSIYGRTDCCTQRDIYNVSIFNAAGSLLYSTSGLNADRKTGTITFDAPSVVPEPASWALMLTGFAFVGAGMRRRSGLINA